MKRKVFAGIVTGLAVCALLAGTALADESLSSLQAALDEANAHYEELSLQVAMAGEALNDTYYRLETTKGDIEDTTQEIDDAMRRLEEAQDVLARRVSASYRAGSVSLIDMIVGADSLEDFISAIYYADRVAEQDAASIRAVQDTRTELDNHRASLEELRLNQEALAAQEEEQLAALQGSIEAQEGYIASLDAQVREKLEEQRAAELAAQQAAAAEEQARQQAAAEAAARKSEEERQAAQQSQSADVQDGEASQDSAGAQETTQGQAPAEQPQTNSQTASSSGTSANGDTDTASASDSGATSTQATGARATILAAAYSQIGVPYVFGAYSPGSALDCSGFTKYCYAQAGYTLPHSSAGQAAMARTCSLSELQPGDLVFWIGTASGSGSGSHVAIYLGNGQIIHANGTRVATGTLSSTWTSCGSIV